MWSPVPRPYRKCQPRPQSAFPWRKRNVRRPEVRGSVFYIVLLSVSYPGLKNRNNLSWSSLLYMFIYTMWWILCALWLVFTHDLLGANHFTSDRGRVGGGWYWKNLQGHMGEKKILRKSSVQKTFTHVQWAGNNYSAKILPKKCFIILCGSFCFGHRNNPDTLPVRATTRTGYMITSPKFSTWRPNQGTRSRVTFQLFATPRNDLFPQYLRSCAFEWWGSTWVWKKKATDEACVFSRGKKAEKISSKIYLTRRKTSEDRKVCFNFGSLKKRFFEIYIKFAWWCFCCRSAKHFHVVRCVWMCNSELRHVRIFVTPCSFYVLLQCDGKACCFFGIKMPVGWQKISKTRTVQIALVDLRSIYT